MNKYKNKIVIFLMSSALLLVSVLSACSETLTINENPTQIPSEYVSSYLPPVIGELPEFHSSVAITKMPEKAITYRIVYPTITKEYVVDMGKKFGIVGDVFEGDDQFSIIDKTSNDTIEVFKSGAIWFSTGSYMDINYNIEAQLPSENEAIDIAINYLEEKKLLPEEYKQYAKAGIGGTVQGKPAHILVSFRYYIGEYPVEGPGFRYLVRIGNNGNIGEVFIYNPQVEIYTEVELVTIEQAFEALQKGNGSWTTYNEKIIDLNEVELRYYLFPITETQEYILPIYVFHGYGKSDDGVTGNKAQAMTNATKVRIDK